MEGDAVVEEVLTGGHDTGSVMRVGSTVRRPVRDWTPAVHALLRHLEAVGYSAAPRVIGIDEQGREILTYIAGQDGRDARCYGEFALMRVAAMINELHQALASFKPPMNSRWRSDSRAPEGNLICHNDLSPANTIYRDGKPQAFIDWDFATPTTRMWDLAYAVRTFVPLYRREDCLHLGYSVDQRTDRLRLFCDAYGMDAQLRADLLPAIRDRLAGETTAFAGRCRLALAENWDEWRRATTA